ncbi:MAG: M28 family peptidase [Bacteroidales bacterium]
MQRNSLLLCALFLSSVMLSGQTRVQPPSSPAEKDFAGTLRFLSSDWMEGREAGSRGGFMAADYIASMMQLYGLSPYGDQEKSNPGHSKNHEGMPVMQQSYFQNFEVLRVKPEKATLALVRRTSDTESEIQLSPGIDFDLKSVFNGIEAEAPLVFAGYGISAGDQGYDDYNGLIVKDRIVVVLEGFPGHADTTSPAWRKLGKYFSDGRASWEKKLQTAARKGAMALVVVSADGRHNPYSHSQHNLDIMQSSMNSAITGEPRYDDPEYFLPCDTTIDKAPVVILGDNAMNQLFSGTGIVVPDFEKRVAGNISPASMLLKEKRLKISVEVKTESLVVHNVLGIIRGKDTTKSVVIGAHYDHLGMRNGLIYHGADDNASGTSGMLALARKWSEHGEMPACNIIFSAWTAEEKGLLGSSYFVQHAPGNSHHIVLAFNMDMISRSAPEDTAHRVLSIGTLPSDDRLRKMAGDINQRLSRPFVLDLWDVTGHTGSDYGSFIAVKIPVMTFFSGFHDDYHTPRDVSSKADLEKMQDILKVVNDCVQEFTGNPLSE